MLLKSLEINQPLAVNFLTPSTLMDLNIHTSHFLRHSDIFGYNGNLFEYIRKLDSSYTGYCAVATCRGLSIS